MGGWYLRRGPQTVVIGQRLDAAGPGRRHIAALVAKIDANHGHFLNSSLSSGRYSNSIDSVADTLFGCLPFLLVFYFSFFGAEQRDRNVLVLFVFQLLQNIQVFNVSDGELDKMFIKHTTTHVSACYLLVSFDKQVQNIRFDICFSHSHQLWIRFSPANGNF